MRKRNVDCRDSAKTLPGSRYPDASPKRGGSTARSAFASAAFAWREQSLRRLRRSAPRRTGVFGHHRILGGHCPARSDPNIG